MVFSQFFSLLMPALLITMSRRPNVSTVLWNASVRQKQRGVSEGLQKLERYCTLSRKLRMRLNQNASLCHFEKKKRVTRSMTVHDLHKIRYALSFPLVVLQTLGGNELLVRHIDADYLENIYLQIVSIHSLLKRCTSKPNDVKTCEYQSNRL